MFEAGPCASPVHACCDNALVLQSAEDLAIAALGSLAGPSPSSEEVERDSVDCRTRAGSPSSGTCFADQPLGIVVGRPWPHEVQSVPLHTNFGGGDPEGRSIQTCGASAPGCSATSQHRSPSGAAWRGSLARTCLASVRRSPLPLVHTCAPQQMSLGLDPGHRTRRAAGLEESSLPVVRHLSSLVAPGWRLSGHGTNARRSLSAPLARFPSKRRHRTRACNVATPRTPHRLCERTHSRDFGREVGSKGKFGRSVGTGSRDPPAERLWNIELLMCSTLHGAGETCVELLKLQSGPPLLRGDDARISLVGEVGSQSEVESLRGNAMSWRDVLGTTRMSEQRAAFAGSRALVRLSSKTARLGFGRGDPRKWHLRTRPSRGRAAAVRGQLRGKQQVLHTRSAASEDGVPRWLMPRIAVDASAMRCPGRSASNRRLAPSRPSRRRWT